MSQHDYEFADADGADFRIDMNGVLGAIVTTNLGPAEPPSRHAGMFWFDTSDEDGPAVLRLRRAQNDAWQRVPTGADFLPSDGGDITGDLHVAGTFSNGEFNAMRGSHAGPTAPSVPAPGMLWYDTSVSPPALRVRNAANTGWQGALPTANPTFQDAITISGTLGASLDLVATSEKRRVYDDAAGNRMAFYAPGDVLAAYFTDAGDFATALMPGGLKAALLGKQPTLGFTPVQQGGGAGMNAAIQISVGWNGHLLVQQATTAWGYAYTSTDKPPAVQVQWQRGDLTAISFATRNSVTWFGNDVVSGVGLRYGWDGAREGSGDLPGSWRNLAGGPIASRNVVCQRVL